MESALVVRLLDNLRATLERGDISSNKYEEECGEICAARDAYMTGDTAIAKAVLETAAARGNSAAWVLLAQIAEQDGDLAAGRLLFRRAAEAGNAIGAHWLGFRLAETGEHDAGAVWLQRAVELGEATAIPTLGDLLWRFLGRQEDAEQILLPAVRAGDPEAMEVVAMCLLAEEAISGDEFDRRMEEAAQLSLEIELRAAPWAQIDDLAQLSADELGTWDAEFAAWREQDRHLLAILREKGVAALPSPLRDGPRLRVRLEHSRNWLVRRGALQRERITRAFTNADAAELARRRFETPDGVTAPTHAMTGGPSTLLDLQGCRLVAGSADSRPIAGLTVRIAAGEPIVLGLGSEQMTLAWNDLQKISVADLPDRTRVTAPRAVGLGLLSLAAKKRQGWSVLTIGCRARQFVLEVPVTAHRLRGELVNAGVPVSAT